MPVDDPAAKDSVVLGPDLVAALGFEPVSADREDSDDQSSSDVPPTVAGSNGDVGTDQDDPTPAGAGSPTAADRSDRSILDGFTDASVSDPSAVDDSEVDGSSIIGAAGTAASFGGEGKGSKRRRFGLGRLQEALGAPVPAGNEGGSTRDLFASDQRLDDVADAEVEPTGSVNGQTDFADPDALDASPDSAGDDDETAQMDTSGSARADDPASTVGDDPVLSDGLVADEPSRLGAEDDELGDESHAGHGAQRVDAARITDDDVADPHAADLESPAAEWTGETATDYREDEADQSDGDVLADFYDQDKSPTGETDLIDADDDGDDQFSDDGSSSSWFDTDYDDVDPTALVGPDGTLDIRDHEIDLVEADQDYRGSTTAVSAIPTGPPSFEEAEVARVEEGSRRRVRHKLRARKVRRVIRHIDPWSVLLFSVLFHLVIFTSLLLAGILVWNAAIAAGTVENIENFIRELADYETFEIHSDAVFKAGVTIAALATLASATMSVLMTVIFNLISDLIGGIRVTVIEEETVRVPAKRAMREKK